MFIKKILVLSILISAITGCSQRGEWNAEYGTAPATTPSQIQGVYYYPEYGIYGQTGHNTGLTTINGTKTISVLLPMSGPNSAVGRGISTSLELAFLQRRYENISVTFFDLTGNRTQKQDIIATALSEQPDIVLGPVFAEDVRLVRDMKPSDLPVLSFSSDTSALGGGVMTMALVPAQSVEVIVKEISNDKANGFVILAPSTSSGKLMAGSAVLAANTYDVPVAGLFYYNEGDTESVKQAAQRAAMFVARSAANTRAREILSDILLKESLTSTQKSSVTTQLEKISKSDTIGKVPYDAVLFLGNANDSRNIASFLRYYDVATRDVQFYGTAIWDGAEFQNDLTMTGAKFAALPAISESFTRLYEQAAGNIPSRLDTFGFDAANLAIGMLYSSKSSAAYLLDPSGYKGLDGLFRLRPDGASERALNVMELTGGGDTRLRRPAPVNFLTPVYSVPAYQTSQAKEIALISKGINPTDYINIPEHLRVKYKSKTYGANMTAEPGGTQTTDTTQIVIMPEDDRDIDIYADPDFQPIGLEQIDRQLIDSVEVYE